MTTNSEREAYNRTDWPGSESFHPKHLRTTPNAAGHIRKTEDYDGNVEGCIHDCPGCKESGKEMTKAIAVKRPTAEELAALAKEAHSSCRCDGGNTMNCGACCAERKIDALLKAGFIVRIPTQKPFTNPAYMLVVKWRVARPVPVAQSYRDVLVEIGNIIGGPTCGYNSAVEVAEWRRRAARISELIQAHLKGGK